MATVEDYLETLGESLYSYYDPAHNSSGQSISASWDRQFISDLSSKTKEGKQLSTAQADIAVKLVNRYKRILIARDHIASEIEQCVGSPTYRKGLYQSTHLPREVRYAGQKRLLFRSKYNPTLVRELKGLKNTGADVRFYNKDDAKIWVVEVNERNLEKIMEIIKTYKFGFDDEVTEFLTKCANAKEEKSEISFDETSLEIVVTVKNDSFMASWIKELLGAKDV